MKPETIASDAIKLFVEYRDKHGCDEETAHAKALCDVQDALNAEIGDVDLGKQPEGALAPCPFCGCDQIGIGRPTAAFMVFCGNGECGARVLDYDLTKAKERWQKRPLPTP